MLEIEKIRLPKKDSKTSSESNPIETEDSTIRSPGLLKKLQFIKGPIPLYWISVASHLPGKSLQVGLAIWFAAGLRKSKTVTLSQKWYQPFGVGPTSLRESLDRLESVGLIRVERRDRKARVVNILDVQPPTENEED